VKNTNSDQEEIATKKEPKKPKHTRPIGITIIAILFLIISVVFLLTRFPVGFKLNWKAFDTYSMITRAQWLASFGASLIAFIASISLLGRRMWGWWLFSIFLAIALLGSIIAIIRTGEFTYLIGIAIWGFILYYLIRVKKRFVIMSNKPLTKAILIVCIPILAIVLNIVIPDLLAAPQRVKQKQTIKTMWNISCAIDAYMVENLRPPDHMEKLSPGYIKNLQLKDAWNHPFIYQIIEENTYFLYSYGRDGIKEDTQFDPFYPAEHYYKNSIMSDFDKDIVLSLGHFIRGPKEYIEKEIWKY
jgi:type II secretory pathway pseudopilin PulG